MGNQHVGAGWPEWTQPEAADITIVGLGPGGLADLTLGAWRSLVACNRLIVRTLHHPCVQEVARHRAVESCDDLYEAHADFSAVYAAISRRVLELGRMAGGVVYAVPGHPWVGEATTALILAGAAAAGLSVRVVGGMSFVAPCFAAVGVDLLDGSQVVDATLLAREHHPRLDVGLPLLVGQVYARWLASEVKLTLMNAYPDDHPVTLLRSIGTPQQQSIALPLHALDQGEHFDHLTSAYVPPLARGSFTDLQEIIARLRAPEGCPWDREQTLASLRRDLLGECAEVLEAIDVEANGGDNSDHIAEELGDLLLVATMMVQIAADEERFRMADVIRLVVTKLIRRHPHVFGDTAVTGVDDVLANWDAIKAAEKAAKGTAPVGPLDGIPAVLPALEKARELQSKAAKAGLLDRKALATSNPALAALAGPLPTEESLGEVLWTLVALAQQHGVDAEDALRSYAVAYREKHAR